MEGRRISQRIISRKYGIPRNLANLMGPESEKIIFRLVLLSHADLVSDHCVDQNWEEDQITQELYDKIQDNWRDLPKKPPYNFRPSHQFRLYPKLKKSGMTRAIDFVFRNSFCDEDYFFFECKRINSHQNGLIQKYYDEGIQRYVTGWYSERKDRGGMVGYIIKDSPPPVVHKINQVIKQYDLNPVAQLTQNTTLLENCHILYISRHIRITDHQLFNIFHFFLAF